jgi:hypothetical protein
MIRPNEIKGTPPTAKQVAWHVSYNNEPPIQVQAITERQAIAVALEALGITAPVHPIRAWPIKES